MDEEYLDTTPNKFINVNQTRAQEMMFDDDLNNLQHVDDSKLSVMTYADCINELIAQLKQDDSMLDQSVRLRLLELDSIKNINQASTENAAAIAQILLLDQSNRFRYDEKLWTNVSSYRRMINTDMQKLQFFDQHHLYQIRELLYEYQVRCIFKYQIDNDHHLIFGCSLTRRWTLEPVSQTWQWFDDDNQILFNNHPELMSDEQLANYLKKQYPKTITETFDLPRQLPKYDLEDIPKVNPKMTSTLQDLIFWSKSQDPCDSKAITDLYNIVEPTADICEIIKLTEPKRRELQKLLADLITDNLLSFKYGAKKYQLQILTGLQLLECANVNQLSETKLDRPSFVTSKNGKVHEKRRKYLRSGILTKKQLSYNNDDNDWLFLSTESNNLRSIDNGGTETSRYYRLNLFDADVNYINERPYDRLDDHIVMLPSYAVVTLDDVYTICEFMVTDRDETFASKIQMQVNLHRTAKGNITFKVNNLAKHQSIAQYINVIGADEMPSRFVRQKINYYRKVDGTHRKPSKKNKAEQREQYRQKMADVMQWKFNQSAVYRPRMSDKSIDYLNRMLDIMSK